MGFIEILLTGVGLSMDAFAVSICKGLANEAAGLTAELLAAKEPLTIVNEDIIPALNRVGEGFEKKTIYLPQLLMAAEAAGAAFEQIKAAMAQGEPAPKKGTFVLATVEGEEITALAIAAAGRCARFDRFCFSFEELVDLLVKKAYSMTFGARNLRRTIQRDLEDPISVKIIDSFEKPISSIYVDVCDDQIVLNAE